MELVLLVVFILVIVWWYQEFTSTYGEIEDIYDKYAERSDKRKREKKFDIRQVLAKAVNGQKLTKDEEEFLIDYLAENGGRIRQAQEIAEDAIYSPFNPNDMY